MRAAATKLTVYFSERMAPPAESASALKLTLYGGRRTRVNGQAGYVATVDRLAAAGASGASVLLAVDGTLHGERRRARFFARNADVPLMVIVVGNPDRVAAALPELAGMLDTPVATVERVQVCRAAGQRVSEPANLALPDGARGPIRQKHRQPRAHPSALVAGRRADPRARTSHQRTGPGLVHGAITPSSPPGHLRGGRSRQAGEAGPMPGLVGTQVVIFQENVSFDHYFGTYPHATNPSREPR
ncbi:MAG: DUF190 domain-containing protein [Solirubrobacteraceae bacterium]